MNNSVSAYDRLGAKAARMTQTPAGMCVTIALGKPIRLLETCNKLRCDADQAGPEKNTRACTGAAWNAATARQQRIHNRVHLRRT